MPTITVFVDGVDRSLLVSRDKALSYSRDINGQGTATFTLADVPSGFVPDDGMEVLIKEDGVDRFAGIINGRPRGFHGPDSANQLTFYEIDVASWEQRLNKRRVWRTCNKTLFEDIVADLNTDFLDSEGFTLDILAGSLITITFNGETVAECFDKLCSEETDGRIWYSTPAKVITVLVQTTLAAPVILTARNVELNKPAPTIEPDRTGYANMVTVVGGNPDMPILYTAQDGGEIAARQAIEGGSGIYHFRLEDNELVTAGQVQQRAEGILEQKKVIRQKFVGMTNEIGFEVAQTVVIDLPNLDIDMATDDFLIVNVETVVSPGVRELWHTITAVDGPIDGSWQSEYRRNIKPRTIPMQIEATPGLVRIESEAGGLVHDPDRDPMEWFQGALSGALSTTPTGIGVTHRRISGDGSGNYMVTIRRGPAATPRQQIMEKWPISAAEVVSTSPSSTFQWNEFAASGQFKDRVIIDPTSTWAVFVQYGAPGTLGVVNLNGGGLIGSVASTLSAQGNMGEAVWVGNYVYIPNIGDGQMFIYDLTDPTAPVEVGSFLSSLSQLAAIIPDSAGENLYLTGTDGVVAVDILADPEAPGPQLDSGALAIDVDSVAGSFDRGGGSFVADGFLAGQSILGSGFANGGNNTYFVIDTVAALQIVVVDSAGMVTESGSGDEQLDAIEDTALRSIDDYASIDISAGDDLIGAAVRIDANNVRVLALNVAGSTITLNAETPLALPQSQMLGNGAILEDGALIVFSGRNQTGANTLRAHVFDLTDPAAPTVIATLSYSNSNSSNVGPARSTYGRKALYSFNSGANVQVTYGVEAFDKIVPYTIGALNPGGLATRPIPPRFGGTGQREGNAGNLLAWTGRQDIGRIDPPERDDQTLVADFSEPGRMKWKESLMRNLVNGSFVEQFTAEVTSDGATVTLALEQSGGGDLTMLFSHDTSRLDCTPALTVALTAGSDVSPTENYVYVLKSDKILTVSTSDWPAAQHNKIAFLLVPSAGFVQTDGPYINQNWNDFLYGSDGMGHLLHMAERQRVSGAIYHSGIAGAGTTGYVTITPGSPDTIHVKSAAGVIYQVHRHAYVANDTSVADQILVVNDSGAAYDEITDLADKLLDATGASMSGKYYNLVLWGVGNQSGEFHPLMINLPGGSYNNQGDAEADVDGFDVFTIPGAFALESSTGFLIARITLKHSPGGGGTWTHISTVDLRGTTPQSASGTGGVAVTSFPDNVFEIHDEGDVTKIMAFEVAGVATGTRRTYDAPDGSGEMVLTPMIKPLDMGGFLVDNAPIIRGYIDGFQTSNDTDTAHDILVGPGVCADVLVGNDRIIELAAGITKQIDAAWAEGDDAGGMATGTVANDTEYNLIVIEEDATPGNIDITFDVSATGANSPAGWTAVRRIGSVFTNGSANVHQYTQYLDHFHYDAGLNDVVDVGGTLATWITGTLTVPPGMRAHYRIRGTCGATVLTYGHVQTKGGAMGTGQNTASFVSQDNQVNASIGVGGGDGWVLVDASSQVEYRLNATGVPPGSETWQALAIHTRGWLDTRGRNE